MRGLFSSLYSSVITARNRAFDAGRGVKKLDVPVISIGNLSMGGSGKSPTTALVTELLQEMGYHPAIVSRGYGRRSRGLVVVSDGTTLNTNAEQCGDETLMLAHMLPSAVVIAAEVRMHGATKAIRDFACDCVVLDDGFQHRKLHRSLDIVIVDRNTLDHARVVPAGVLREELKGLLRADIILLREGVDAAEVETFRRSDSTVYMLNTAREGVKTSRGVELEARDVSVVLLCGIAQPVRFQARAEALGFNVCHSMFFRDHVRYTESIVRESIETAIRSDARVILTTEKDMVKLRDFQSLFDRAGVSLSVLWQRLSVSDTAAFSRQLRGLFKT